MADAGEIWAKYLSEAGRNIGNAITSQNKQYNAMKQMDATVEALNAMLPEDDPDRKAFSRVYERYQQYSGRQKAQVAEGIMKAWPMYLATERHKDAYLLNRARIGSEEALTRKREVETGQLTGEIPKPARPPTPPTGGQILMEQRSERKERAKERDAIEKKIDDISHGADPELFLDDKKWKRGILTKEGFIHSSKFEATDKNPTHVQIPGMDREIPIQRAQRLHNLAKQWKDLQKPPSPQINAPPEHVSFLIKNPTPENKAYFDQLYGQGAADTVLAAQGKQSTETASKDESGE